MSTVIPGALAKKNAQKQKPATPRAVPGTLVLRDSTGGFALKAGQITNADVSDTAAIVGTKILPNFGNQNIVSTGDVTFGNTVNINVGSGSDDGATIYNTNTLHISRNDAAPLFLRRRTANGNVANFYRDTTLVGSISVTTTATAYNVSSDHRLKEEVQPLAGGLSKISDLQPVKFKWKLDGSSGQGFIAHQLQAVVPEAVTGGKDATDEEGNPEYQGVDASKLVPYLVSAVQELKARIEELEAVSQ